MPSVIPTPNGFLRHTVPERFELLKNMQVRDVLWFRNASSSAEVRKFIDDNEVQIAANYVQRRREDFTEQLERFNYQNYDSLLVALQHFLECRGLWIVENNWDSVGFEYYYTEFCDGALQDVPEVKVYASLLVYLHLWLHTSLRPNMWPHIEALKTEILHFHFSTPWGRTDPRRTNRPWDIGRLLSAGFTNIRILAPAAPNDVAWGVQIPHQPFPHAALTEVKGWQTRNLREPRRRNEGHFVRWEPMYQLYNVPQPQYRWPNGLLSMGPAVAYGVPANMFHWARNIIEFADTPLSKAAIFDEVYVW